MPPNLDQTEKAIIMSTGSFQVRWSPFHNRYAVRRGFVPFPFLSIQLELPEIVSRIRRWVRQTNRRRHPGPLIPVVDITRWDIEGFADNLYAMCREFFAIFDETNRAYRAAYRARAAVEENRRPGAPRRFYGIHIIDLSVEPFAFYTTPEENPIVFGP
ncbi:hypothetical protein SISSUDRAFT_1063648 [Sistotremastrum suecicum HHB10207 ss-3]|uniref:Uncharacterized protein n=1 Tax=Sistotremastrum suecicum HHB10207 ss-3 TaxID=1314776 RepID=A0A166BKW2_9AGAM|nr:hypothetical protein SISSUDRAFT_1063648 [Sistotremastrum suecicum HHB10207 ss-3]